LQKEKENITTRTKMKILERNDQDILWEIISSEQKNLNEIKPKTMIIAMPNQRKKTEIIVQKLTEIWISKIIFRPAERSVIKDFNTKKLERLNLIAKESTEQSHWRKLPEINFVKKIESEIGNQKIIVFDIPQTKQTTPTEFSDIWIVGPEWWLTPKDYQKFGPNTQIVGLWENILRTETASFVGAWLIKNL